MEISPLKIDLTIIQAKNLEPITPKGTIFIRYYLSSKIQLNTQEISPKSNPIWNQSFSLECHGNKDAIDNLNQEMVVFELRWRKRVPIIGNVGGSKIMGRAEIPWKSVFESPNMEMKKWVSLISNKDEKICSLEVELKIKAPSLEDISKKKKKRNLKEKKWDEYVCHDYDMFLLASAMDAF